MIFKELTGDGETIDFSSFLAILIKINEKVVDSNDDTALRTSFKNFDFDNDGFITHTELKAFMASIGEEMNDEEIVF